MSELKRRTDINKKIEIDKMLREKETKRADLVVQDADLVDAADKKNEFKCTEEGTKEILEMLSKQNDNEKNT